MTINWPGPVPLSTCFTIVDWRIFRETAIFTMVDAKPSLSTPRCKWQTKTTPWCRAIDSPCDGAFGAFPYLYGWYDGRNHGQVHPAAGWPYPNQYRPKDIGK